LKGVCDFLLVINSDHGPFCHRFRDTASYSLKLFIENCSQSVADEDMVTIDSFLKSPTPYIVFGLFIRPS